MFKLIGATAASVVCLLASAAVAVADDYVALGDSYSSGTGTREYFDSGCQRSIYAYPELVADEVPGLELDFVACSGAETSDVLSGQVSSLSSATDLVTISIGGNDAGFADVITECALPGWLSDCPGALDDAEEFIEATLPGRLDDVYDAISEDAPNAETVVLSYPRLFNGEDCNGGTFFSSSELKRLNEVADLLRDVTQERVAAAGAGFEFVNAIPTFVGHAVCDSPEWLNGLSWPVGESFHPNKLGHSNGYAPLVLEAIE
jgi:lysophospholipase L1-like esterase